MRLGRLPGLLALLVALAAVCLPRPCWASPRDAQGNPLFAIKALSEDERALIHAAAALDDAARAACQNKPSSCALQRSVSGPWQDALVRAVAHAVSTKGWRAAVVSQLDLGSLLGTRNADADVLAAKLQAAYTAEDNAHKPGTCALLVTSHIFDWKRIETCLGAGASNLIDELRDAYDPLLLQVRPGERSFVTTSGPTPEVFEATAEIGDKTGRFFALVRRGSTVTVRVNAKDERSPPFVRSVASDAGFFDADVRPPKVCLSIDLLPQRDPARRIFVNGRLVAPATVVEVDDERYDREAEPPNVTITQAHGKSILILVSTTLSWDELPRSGCQSIPFDLRPPSAVALVRVDVAKPCFELGVDPGDVQARVETLVSETGLEVRAVQRWADTMERFAGQLTRLSQGEGEGLSGKPRGELDSRRLSQVGAAEFVRQGFRSLLTIELGCQPHPEDEARFSFRAYLLDLQQFLDRSEAAGPDLSHAVRSEIEPVLGQDQLDSGIVAALSRLFRAPYVRLGSGEKIQNVRGEVVEVVRVYIPPTPSETVRRSDYTKREVRLWSHLLKPEQGYLCPSDSFLGSPVAEQWWEATQHAPPSEVARFSAPAGVQAVVPIAWDPRTPGTYLIRVELAQADGETGRGETVAFGCTETRDFSNRFWIDTGYQRGRAFAPATTANEQLGTIGYGRLLVGLSHAAGVNSLVGIGVAIGYANAVHSANAPPSWEFDPGAPTPRVYGYDGRVRMDWTRQSVLLAPTFDFRARAPACLTLPACPEVLRAVDLYFRFMPALDLGIFETRNVDSSLRRFLATKSGLDLDTSAFVEAGLWFHLHSEIAMYAAFGASWLGWDDYVLGGRDQNQAQATISYDSIFTFGGTLGVAWNR